MILIKDRHNVMVLFSISDTMEDMILIKDRHMFTFFLFPSSSSIGRYDTYKGSTPSQGTDASLTTSPRKI